MSPEVDEVWSAYGLFPDLFLKDAEPQRVRIAEICGETTVDVEYLDGTGYRILPIVCLIEKVQPTVEGD